MDAEQAERIAAALERIDRSLELLADCARIFISPLNDDYFTLGELVTAVQELKQ